MNVFTVILAKPERREPVMLAKALAAFRKTPVQDQILGAKGSWGIVAEHLLEVEARKLGEGLKSAGLECAILPDSGVVVLPAAQPLKSAEPGWLEGLVLVSAAGWNNTSTTTRVEHQGPSAAQQILSTGLMLATGLPIKIGPKKQDIKREHTTSEQVFYVDLLYGNPSGQVTHQRRVDAQKFDYSFLQSRRLFHVLGNLKLLLEAALTSSPRAWQNHGATVLLKNLPVASMEYHSLADLERETRWLLTLQTLRS